MRKQLLLPSLLAISLLTAGSSLALACGGGKTTKTASAGAAGHCGSAAVQTAGAGGHCSGAAMKTADGKACASQGDFFVSNYMCLSGAMKGHCATSSQTAAKSWHEGLQALIASGKAAEHSAELNSLAVQLADWPADAALAQARFAAVSEWTARYCERFPEKAAGAKVVSEPETGRRWVELADASADGNS